MTMSERSLIVMNPLQINHLYLSELYSDLQFSVKPSSLFWFTLVL